MNILRTTFALVCLIAVTACSPSGSDNKAAPASEAPALRTTPLVAQSPAAQAATLSPPTEAEVMEAAAKKLFPFSGCNSDPRMTVKPGDERGKGFRCGDPQAGDIMEIQVKVLSKADQGNNQWKVDVEATPMPLISQADLTPEQSMAFGMSMQGAFEGPTGSEFFKKGVPLPTKRASLTLENKGFGWYAAN